MLGIMSEISMDLIGNISVALFTSNEAMELLTGDSASGVMYSITQQLGLGLMLSTLLIVVPPMAGMWFNGVMGSFSPYAVIGGGNRQEVPPHLDSGASRQQVVTNVDERMTHSHTQHQQPISNYTTGGYGNANQSVDYNTVKPIGQSKIGANQTQHTKQNETEEHS